MIALLGGKGSIGRRYAAILRYYGINYVVLDDPEGVNLLGIETPIDKVIIATPPESHLYYVECCEQMGVPYLCEKPLAKEPVTGEYPSGYMVCQYKYVVEEMIGDDEPFLRYDYYNTGRDGAHDYAQLLYLDPGAIIHTDSPIWRFQVNGDDVPYRLMEASYMHMIRDFCAGNYYRLWTIEDGKRMIEEVLRYEGTSRDTGENE